MVLKVKYCSAMCIKTYKYPVALNIRYSLLMFIFFTFAFFTFSLSMSFCFIFAS